MQQEKIIFQASDMLITNARIRLQGGKTFSTANVTSVQTTIHEYPEPSKAGPIWLIVIGIFFGLGGFGSIGSSLGGGFFLLLIAAALILGGVMWIKSIVREKPDYILMIGSASGETEGMRSKDQSLIARVSDAINDAIVARG